MKTQIIGYSGSGKSTLADRLARVQGISVLHIDCVHWLPGWTARPSAESSAIIGDFLDTHDAWVIDGNYTSHHYSRRMEEADQIILMNFNRFACLWRAFRRRLQYHGKARSSMTEGCPEKLDLPFIWWILHEGRTHRTKERYRALAKTYPDKFVTIRNQKELDAFYANNHL